MSDIDNIQIIISDNSCGKTIFLKKIALICILAQIGKNHQICKKTFFSHNFNFLIKRLLCSLPKSYSQ